ncbi:MAG: DUF4271 domain-containing protein [Chitinophagia bacterium]|jgi:hypothetical protein
MWTILKKGIWLIGAWLFLSAFAQKDNLVLKQDTSGKATDSLLKKDTLLITYVPVVPKSFQLSDAWFIESNHDLKVDSNFNPLKDYTAYFGNRKKAFQLYFKNALINNDNQVIYKIEQRFSLPDKDFLFYLIVAMLLMYGFINTIYPQYFQKLFSQFNQSTLRMMQNREQLLQNGFASLTLNICFILSFSLMASLLIFNNHLLPISFWQGYLYIALFFSSLYLGKYICLEIAGAIFNTKELAKSYIFVVFMVNKVLGFLLVPFVLILAFARPFYYSAAAYGAAGVSVLLLLYRYLFSITSVRNKLHLSSFHFFLYLCAFEILPLLILYKLVVQYFGGTY